MMGIFAAVLIGFAALALDAGVWEVDLGAMQGAADQAALAAAFAIGTGSDAAAQEAKGIAAADGFVDQAGGVTVTVNIPPRSGTYTGTAGAIEVAITQPQPEFLSSWFLSAQPLASARAVVVPSPGNACIVALKPSGTGILGSGNATVDAGSCNIYVNSPSACDVLLSGNIYVTGYNVYLGEPNTAGCTSGSSSLTATDRLQFNAPPVLDPYASRTMPAPTLPCTNPPSGSSPTLVPGTTYCGFALSGHPDVTMPSGVYIFTGSVTLSGGGTINGTNATMVFTNGASLSLSGSSTLNLTPMTSGPTAGIALWFDKNSTGTLNASGTTPLNITGAVYAPAANLTWSGNVHSPCTQLVAGSITLSGNAAFSHDCTGLGVADPAGAGLYRLLE